jgi:2-polyprenyl-6-methoxyphenol hydroxylase-like FAD-dependent oxidoreductase
MPAIMQTRFDVSIRGAGIVGRTLALMLAQQSLRVGLIAPSRDAPIQDDVRAYALNHAAKDMLSQLRCWPNDAAVCTPLARMQVMGDARGELCFDAAAQGQDALGWIVDVPVLEQLLAQATSFQPNIVVVNDGREVRADLTVVCEGRASQTREQFGVVHDTFSYAHHALACRARAEQAHSGTAHQWFTSPAAQADARILGLLPMGGQAGQELAVVWSLPPEQADELLHLDAAVFEEQLTEASHSTLGRLQLVSARAVWPLQLSKAQRWIGQVPGQSQAAFALAGDAAHTMHPLAGQGLNVGLADVKVLSEVLAGREYWRPFHDLKLLRRYERARQADVWAMQGLTDGLYHLFGDASPLLGTLRNQGMQAINHLPLLKHWLGRQAMGQPLGPHLQP